MHMPTRALVVASCNAPPVIETGEAILVLVALTVSGLVMGDRDQAVLSEGCTA